MGSRFPLLCLTLAKAVVGVCSWSSLGSLDRDVVVLPLYWGVSSIVPFLRVATGMRLPRARSHVLVLMSRRQTPNYRLLD